MTAKLGVYLECSIRAGHPEFREMCHDTSKMCQDDVWGPFCTLLHGHEGDHMAHAYASVIVARWTQGSA
jgi:hypothetical protein